MIFSGRNPLSVLSQILWNEKNAEQREAWSGRSLETLRTFENADLIYCDDAAYSGKQMAEAVSEFRAHMHATAKLHIVLGAATQPGEMLIHRAWAGQVQVQVGFMLRTLEKVGEEAQDLAEKFEDEAQKLVKWIRCF